MEIVCKFTDVFTFKQNQRLVLYARNGTSIVGTCPIIVQFVFSRISFISQYIHNILNLLVVD